MVKKILKGEQMAHWAHGSKTEILWKLELAVATMWKRVYKYMESKQYTSTWYMVHRRNQRGN